MEDTCPEHQPYCTSAVAFSKASFWIMLVGYLSLLAYFLRVMYIIHQRLLTTLTVIWSFFCATIVFQIAYCLLYITPNFNETGCEALFINQGTNSYQVFGFLTLTTKQLAFLIFCFCYNELEVTFRKIFYLTTEVDETKRKIRWALFALIGIGIVIFNILYRVFIYITGEPWIYALNLITVTVPFVIEFVIFAVALYRIRKLSLQHGELFVKEVIMKWHILFFGSFVASTVALSFSTQKRDVAYSEY